MPLVLEMSEVIKKANLMRSEYKIDYHYETYLKKMFMVLVLQFRMKIYVIVVF